MIVPSDDWAAPADDAPLAAPARLHRGTDAGRGRRSARWPTAGRRRRPALVVGADADDPATWAALVALAERLGAPVWQEAFAARAGFPQDHPLFAGHLPAGRARLREALAGHDVVLAVGAPVFRQYPYEQGPLVDPGTTVVLITDDPEDAHHSPVQLAVVAGPAAVCAALAERLPARSARPRRPTGRRRPPAARRRRTAAGRARDGRAGQRIAAETVVVEETPVEPSRPAPAAPGPGPARLPQRRDGRPRLRAARRDRRADGRAAPPGRRGRRRRLVALRHPGVVERRALRLGVLFVVLANGRYAVMDRLAEQHGAGKAPWPAFEEVSISRLGGGLGCPATRVGTHDELLKVLDDVVPTLGERTEPLVLEVAVVPDTTFAP